MRLACALLPLLLLLALPAHANPSQNPQAALEAGKLAYQRQQYLSVEETVRPLLYPTPELTSDESVVEARRILALAYFFQKKYPEARQEVVQILAVKPDYQLDRYVDPPVAIGFFEAIRREQDDRLEMVRRREREEEAARKREEELRRRQTAERERVVIERTVEKHSRLYAFLPFGIGQFQNGHRKKAAVFLATELTLGALSLACWAAIPAAFDLANVQPSQGSTLNTLNYTQLAAGAAFWAVVAIGIIEANVRFVPTVTRERRRARLTITPFSFGGVF